MAAAVHLVPHSQTSDDTVRKDVEGASRIIVITLAAVIVIGLVPMLALILAS